MCILLHFFTIKVFIMSVRTLLLTFFLLFSSSLYAQRIAPYNLKWQREIPLLVTGGLGIGTSAYLYKNKPLLTEEQIKQLDTQLLKPSFDRFATNHWNKSAQYKSDILLYGVAIYPLFLLFDKDVRKELPTVGLITIESFLINSALTGMTKELFKRKRPYLYNPNAPLEPKLGRSATSSFFSGHTSATAMSSFLTAKMYHDFNPNSKWRPLVWTTAALIPAFTGYYRLKGGKHFLSDILVGYAVGALVGVLVPELHKKRN